ncbi:MAG: class I SAM-dependent methyltransferase [Deltaproteobacteria bacterium]|nr:MAG: class I SAM-dependent methyltransferase [Deltaproteobacteria bacterium]
MGIRSRLKQLVEKALRVGLKEEFDSLRQEIQERHQPQIEKLDEISQSLKPKFFSKPGASYQEFWDNMAATREGACYGVAGLPFGLPATNESLKLHGEPTARVIIESLGIDAEHSVLEVGVGIGRLAEHIAPHCREFYGVDISSRMLNLARERLKDLGNVHLQQLTNDDLRIFPKDRFDRIFFQIVLVHLDREDIFNYLRESFRVLKKGGKGYFQFYNLLHEKGFREFLNSANATATSGGKSRGRVHCYTAPEVRKLIEEAGFTIDEANSHLEMVEQKFNYRFPEGYWDDYLQRIRAILRNSGLNEEEQNAHFDEIKKGIIYSAPDADWEYYLIAVGDKN